MLINAGQQVTRAEAIRLYTAANGWFLHEEDKLGTIEPGKLGDLTIVEGDLLTMPAKDLWKAKVLATVVGGEVVYSAPR